LLNGGRIDFHPYNLARAGAKHLQGVKAVVCPKIENSTAMWDGDILSQRLPPTQRAEIWIPNRPPADSGARIEGGVRSCAREQTMASQPFCGDQICADEPIELIGIAVSEISRGRT